MKLTEAEKKNEIKRAIIILSLFAIFIISIIVMTVTFQKEKYTCLKKNPILVKARIFEIVYRKSQHEALYEFFVKETRKVGGVSLKYNFKVGDEIDIVYCSNDPDYHDYIKDYEEEIK